MNKPKVPHVQNYTLPDHLVMSGPGEINRRTSLEQVAAWSNFQHGPAVSFDVARHVAEWYATTEDDDVPLVEFATRGIITEMLHDNIVDLVEGQPHGTAWTDDGDTAALLALDNHVLRAQIRVWTVGQNVPGFLPDNAPDVFVDYGDAIQAHRDAILGAILDAEECGEPTHFIDEAKSYLARSPYLSESGGVMNADGTPCSDANQNEGILPGDIHFLFTYGERPPIVHFLDHDYMTYGEALCLR